MLLRVSGLKGFRRGRRLSDGGCGENFVCPFFLLEQLRYQGCLVLRWSVHIIIIWRVGGLSGGLRGIL